MKGNLFYSLIVSVSLSSLCSCGSIQTHSRDESSVAQIKSAALVAFTEVEPASAKIGLNLNSGKSSAVVGGTMIPQSDDHTDRMFKELGDQFSKNMKWSVMDPQSMAQNPGYLKAYESTMTGFQNKMPPGKGQKQFVVKSIMDFDSPRILDVSGRDQLIDALGVDAIIVARVSVTLNGTTVMGVGARHPQSMLSFMVYTKGHEKPVWFEGGIRGAESAESVGSTGFIDESQLAGLAVSSAESAYTKIGSSSVD